MKRRPSTRAGDNLDADAKWPGGCLGHRRAALVYSYEWVRLRAPIGMDAGLVVRLFGRNYKQGFVVAGPSARSTPLNRLVLRVP